MTWEQVKAAIEYGKAVNINEKENTGSPLDHNGTYEGIKALKEKFEQNEVNMKETWPVVFCGHLTCILCFTTGTGTGPGVVAGCCAMMCANGAVGTYSRKYQ